MNDEENQARHPVAWWTSARVLELPVLCDGATHHLRWDDGGVELVDHPDLEAELAMVALGGAEPACVARYRLWEDAIADGGFLAEWVDETRLSDAWFSWLAMALERMRSEGFHEFLRRLPPRRAQRMGEFLHGFPVPWIDRAAATVNHHLVERDGVTCTLAPELLRDGTAQRVRRAFVDAVGARQLSVGAAALVPLSITVCDKPSVAGLLTGTGRGVELMVPKAWLHQVWAAGAAVIDGELVLLISSAEGQPPEATVIRWSNHPAGLRPELCRQPIRFDGTSWHRH